MYKITTILLVAYIVCASMYQHEKTSLLIEKVDVYEQHIWQLQAMLMKQPVTDWARPMLVSAQVDKTSPGKKVLTVTAYSPTEEECDSNPYTTASNRKVREGIVAVSRDLFNQGWIFGRRVYIKDHGIFTIDDLMSNRKRQCLDILMFDQGLAMEFGKRKLEVYLLDT